MDEGDLAGETRARLPVDHVDAGPEEAPHLLHDVVRLEADVVDALAPAREEAGDAGVGRHGREQLHLARAAGQERRAHPLLGEIGGAEERELERVAPEAEAGFQVPDDDADVVDAADHAVTGWRSVCTVFPTLPQPPWIA